ncbi:MAG: hypothetical protein WC945_08235 [Bacteroidales bacterium]
MKFAKKFIANNKPIKKSKLSELDDDILLLIENKFLVKQIHECIAKDAKISVSLGYLYVYINKLKQSSQTTKNGLASSTDEQKKNALTTQKVEDKKEPQVAEKKNTLASYLKKTNVDEDEEKDWEWKPRFS